MTTLPIKRSNSYDSTVDLFFKNFFDTSSFFSPLFEANIQYPVDIYKDDKGLYLDIAVVGIDKKDLSIISEGDTLRVSYNSEEPQNSPTLSGKTYLSKNIAKRKFDFAWRIPLDYDLNKIEVKLEKGLLQISIPFNDARKVKTIQIK
jgi:HSP20 family molecular chaperone IbpA